MALFSIDNQNVRKIPPIKVGHEKDIQKIFEKNLNEILDITFLASEYPTSFGGRIDTLGIDNNGSPVIIEYKKSQNDNIINQGLSYLHWLLDHKEKFEKFVEKAPSLVIEKKIIHNIPSISRWTPKIDWDSPRVICVAGSYNKFDLDTVSLLPINIELLKYRIYQNNTLLVEPEIQQRVRISTSKVFNKKRQDEMAIIKKRNKYTLEDHLDKTNQKIKKIFEAINEKIVALDESIIVEPKAKYIAYKLATNFVDIMLLKQYGLKIFLNLPSGELNDPHGLARDLTKPKKIGHWGNGDYEVKLKKEEDIEEVFKLIKQSYSYNK